MEPAAPKVENIPMGMKTQCKGYNENKEHPNDIHPLAFGNLL